MSSYLDKAGLARFWSVIKSYVDAHSGGEIDDALSATSKHPVQNKKVKEAVDNLQAQITSNLNSIVQHEDSIESTRDKLAELRHDHDDLVVIVRSILAKVETDAYAVFDSSDGSFTFFRDTKGKYTDGQVSGTKTYYAGFEDITENTYPSWYDSSSDNQKNTIKTVVFKDKIEPKTCYYWFSDASSLTSITGLNKLDTAAVTNMRSMFLRCYSLTSLNVSSFNTENVTDMLRMFSSCYSLTSLDVSSFNTENVTNMSSMFYNCSKLKTIYVSSLFTTNAASLSSNMFYGCTSLVGGAGTTYDTNHKDKTYARIDGGASNPGYFTAKTVTPSSQA